MRKRLVIMRGLPWCGKSTRAEEIAGKEGVVLSTDEYFYKINVPEKSDTYSFNPRLLGKAHQWNQDRANVAMHEETPIIVIDNTNTTSPEPKSYVVMGDEREYEVSIAEPTCRRWVEIRELLLNKKDNKKKLKEWAILLAEGSKATHNVPAFVIEKMMWRWHNDLTIDKILEAKGYGES